MLDDYLRVSVSQGDARLFGVRVRALFGGVSELDIVRLLTRLDNGAGTTSEKLLRWEPRFAQLTRSGLSGSALAATFNALLTGNHALTGQELHDFWSAALGRTGESEILVAIVRELISVQNGLNGEQIRDLVMLFLHGATPWISLSKRELLTALTNLRLKFSPLQTRAFCLFFRANLPGTVRVSAQRFLEICDEVGRGGLTAQNISIALHTHGNLTNADLATLLFTGPFTYCMQYLDTALPPALVLPMNVHNSPGGVLAFAVSKGTARRVAEVLTKAFTATMPCDVLSRLLCHLRHMTAGDRVQRLGTFIDEAAANLTARGRRHTWVEILELVDQFVADLRIANGPAALAVGAQIRRGQCVCSGERIKYFLRAHTYRYFDFTIVDRSKDDITMFPPGMAEAAMRNLVTQVFGALSAAAIEDASDAAEIIISNVRVGMLDYEVGLVAHGGLPPNSVALLHLMPFLANADQYWHKNLLAAVGRLF